MSMRVSNIICDLDGTLADSLPGIEFSAREAVRHCLADRELPSLRQMIGPPISQIFATIWPDLSHEALNCMVSAFRQNYDSSGCLKTVAYPTVVDTLRILSSMGVNLFVLTNKPQHSTNIILRHIGILDLFLDVSTPDQNGAAWANKTDGVKRLIDRRKLRVGETLLVGDSCDDMKAAKECGLGFVPAAYGYGYAKMKDMIPDKPDAGAIGLFKEILSNKFVEASKNGRLI